MNILAIDTSLSRGSVAAVGGDRLAVRWLEPADQHARLLAAAIDEVSAELGWRPADAELVAVVRGPGSFTGLRVGVTTAKGLAWSTGCRILGISGFEVAAHGAAAALTAGGMADALGRAIHVAYDAGRGDLYVATAIPAVASSSGWSVGAGTLVAASDWVANLAPGSVVAGPAMPMLSEAIVRRGNLMAAPIGDLPPGAAEAAAIALARAAAGEAHDPAALVPEYMRQSYAHETAAR